MKAIARFFIVIIVLLSTLPMYSQTIEVKTADEPIRIMPAGRFSLDQAFFLDDNTDLGNGTALSDVRLGLKSYYKNMYMKIDISFAGNKVGIKDVFFQYNIKPNSYVRIGAYAEPFGLDYMESPSNIKFMTPNISTQIVAPGRRLGAQYMGWNKMMWYTAGIFSDNNAITNTMEGDDGYAFTGRYVFNPLRKPGQIFHIGLASTFRSADANGYDTDGVALPKVISYSSNLYSLVEKRKSMSVTVNDADYQLKSAFELLGSFSNLYLQGEYFQTQVKTKHGLPMYKANGIYAQIGCLITGGNYTYSDAWAMIAKPKPGSLELLLRYNYTDLNDKKANIYGGRSSDWTLGANYYINKYIILRFNYSYMSLDRHSLFPSEDIQALQTRLQVVF